MKFIKLTHAFKSHLHPAITVNMATVTTMADKDECASYAAGTCLSFAGEDLTFVKESQAEILELAAA